MPSGIVQTDGWRTSHAAGCAQVPVAAATAAGVVGASVVVVVCSSAAGPVVVAVCSSAAGPVVVLVAAGGGAAADADAMSAASTATLHGGQSSRTADRWAGEPAGYAGRPQRHWGAQCRGGQAGYARHDHREVGRECGARRAVLSGTAGGRARRRVRTRARVRVRASRAGRPAPTCRCAAMAQWRGGCVGGEPDPLCLTVCPFRSPCTAGRAAPRGQVAAAGSGVGGATPECRRRRLTLNRVNDASYACVPRPRYARTGGSTHCRNLPGVWLGTQGGLARRLLRQTCCRARLRSGRER